MRCSSCWRHVWADEIRTEARIQREVVWHFINWPFKPQGEPDSVKPLPARPDNILTAIAENERLVRNTAALAEQRAIALAWLFHLIGDIHQPLHTIQLFSREYPYGDRAGNEVCVRVRQDRAAIPLHRLWDGLITSSNNVRSLHNMAIELLSRLSRSNLSELAITEPQAWAKESFEIATKFAYQNGALRGTPKGQREDCRAVPDAAVLPPGYAAVARTIADRRIMLAGYRLADLLLKISANSVP